MNPSKKACIPLDSFGRFGTFQWVTANPNKKIGATSRLAPIVSKALCQTPPRGHPDAGFASVTGKRLAQTSLFAKHTLPAFRILASIRPGGERGWPRVH